MKFTFGTQGTVTYLIGEKEHTTPINQLVYGMILNNRLFGVAKTILMQQEDNYLVKYDISSRIPLARYFLGVVKKSQVLGVFSSICKTLLEAEEYLLLPENFLLDKEYIYVDIATSSAELIPVLFLEEYPKVNLKEFFRDLLFSLCIDPNEDGAYFAKMVSFLNSPTDLNLKELYDLTQSIDRPPRQVQRPLPYTSAAAPVTAVAPSYAPTQVAAPLSPPTAAAKHIPQSNVKQPAMHQNEKRLDAKTGANNLVMPPFASPAGSVPPAMPEKKAAKGQKTKKGKEEKEKKKNLFNFGKKKEVNHAKKSNPAFAPPQHSPSPLAGGGQQESFSNNFGETVVLKNEVPNGTTLLGASLAQAPTIRPRLRRVKNGQVYYIQKFPYRIGKNKNYVDCCIDDNPAISRAHIDILFENNCYYIMDNNSLNHTWLNNVQLVGSQKVELTHGSNIMLANEEFVFELE